MISDHEKNKQCLVDCLFFFHLLLHLAYVYLISTCLLIGDVLIVSSTNTVGHKPLEVKIDAQISPHAGKP